MNDVPIIGQHWGGPKRAVALANLVTGKLAQVKSGIKRDVSAFMQKVVQPPRNARAGPPAGGGALVNAPHNVNEGRLALVNEEFWIVLPRTFNVCYKNKICNIVTKHVRVAASLLEVLKGKANAWGVIADEDIEEGGCVGVYGGAIEERLYAEDLREPDVLLATHIKNVEGKWKGYLLDGIVNEDEPIKRAMDWYTSRSMIGSIFNDGLGSEH